MPTADLWVQYSLIGILFLSAALIAGAFYRLWKEQTSWLEKQDIARETEREKQRVWEAEQAKQRDTQWQLFLENMQAQWAQNDARGTEVLAQLVSKINDLNVSVNNHDTWARATSTATRKKAG